MARHYEKKGSSKSSSSPSPGKSKPYWEREYDWGAPGAPKFDPTKYTGMKVQCPWKPGRVHSK